MPADRIQGSRRTVRGAISDGVPREEDRADLTGPERGCGVFDLGGERPANALSSTAACRTWLLKSQ